MTPRSGEEVGRFFAGLDILPPGIVGVSNWRTMPGPQASPRVLSYAGVGRKP